MNTRRVFHTGLMLAVSLALAVGAWGTLPAPKALAATCTSAGTGNWESITWTGCTSGPQAGDDVIINSGNTVTIATATNVPELASLTVNGTLRVNTTTAKAMVVTGSVTIASGSSFTVLDAGAATSHSLSVGGDFTNGGTFDAVNGNHYINVTLNGSAAQAIGGSGSGTFDFNNLTIANTAATVSATRNFNVVGTMTVNASAAFSPSATFVIATGGTITGNGTIYVTSVDATNALDGQYNFTTKTLTGMTVDFAAAGDQGIDSLTYGALRTSGSGTKTLTAATVVNGGVTIGAGTTLNIAAITLTVNGGSTLAVNGTLDFTSSTGLVRTGTSGVTTVTMGADGLIRTVDALGLGPVANASFQTQGTGTFDLSSLDTTGTVEYNLNGAQTVTSRNYNNLILSAGGTKTLAGNATIAGDLTVSAGTFDLAAFTADRSAAGGTLTVANGATLLVGGASNFPANYTAVSLGATSTVNYDNAGAQTVSAQTYGHLTISGSGVKTLAGNTVVAGNLTISAGTLDANNNNLSVGGNWTNNGAFTAGSGTVTFNGTAAQNINNSTTFNNLVVSSGANVSIGASVDVTVNGGATLTIDGTLDLGASGQVRSGASGTTVVAMGATGTIRTSNTTAGSVGGLGPGANASFETQTGGSFDLTSLDTNGTVEYYSGSNQTITDRGYNNLTLSGTTTNKTWTLTADRALNGTLTILNTGAFALNGAYTLNVRGDWTHSTTAAFTAGAGNTVAFDGASAQTIGGTGSGADSFTNLVIANTAATVSATKNFNVVGTMTVNANAVFSPSATFVIGTGGTITGNGAIYVTRVDATNALDGQYNFTTKTLDSTMVDFAAAGNQGIDGGLTYGTLRTSGSGTKTLGGAVTVNGSVTIGSGTTFDVSTSNYALNVAGDWTNDGTFTQRSGTVTFNGAAAQTLGGATATTFNNLTINNAAGVGLGNDATVNGTLALTSGDLTTGANTLTLGGSATSSGAGDVVGNSQRTSFAAGTTYSFGNTNVQITFGSTSTLPSAAVVNLAKTTPHGAVNTVSRAYTVTLTGGGDLSATLRLRYLDSELNGNTEAILQLWRYDGTLSQWVQQVGSVVDTTNNWVQASGVTAFSPWAISSGGPTAVTLSGFAARDGGSAASVALPVGLLLASAAAAAGWRFRRRTA